MSLFTIGVVLVGTVIFTMHLIEKNIREMSTFSEQFEEASNEKCECKYHNKK